MFGTPLQLFALDKELSKAGRVVCAVENKEGEGNFRYKLVVRNVKELLLESSCFPSAVCKATGTWRDMA